ncbi:WAS/WASL-interacting protein family member 1-like [Panthera uncia]|uniref:WAS/WASL-interacting protein family member 1-like n=1 Tax=Panthera uncia TaxID=29064 RepID=UPI0020FFD24F|nr:WAS/WASL-interacting protein family member 1-like [Panthera uncia]
MPCWRVPSWKRRVAGAVPVKLRSSPPGLGSPPPEPPGDLPCGGRPSSTGGLATWERRRPVGAHPGTHCSQCLAATSRFALSLPHRPSLADLYAQLGRAASLASSPSTRGPTPSRFLPAIGSEARVGRSPARSRPPAPLLHSSSPALSCAARGRRRRSRPRRGSPGTHSRTLRRADPGDARGAARGAGRGGGERAGVEVGVAGPWGWARRPPALRVLASCQSSPPPPGAGRKPLLALAPRRRGEGKVNGKMEMDVEGVSPRPEPIPRSQGAGGACQAPPQPPQPQPQPPPQPPQQQQQQQQQQQLAQDEVPGESAGVEDSDDPEARPNSEKGESKVGPQCWSCDTFWTKPRISRSGCHFNPSAPPTPSLVCVAVGVAEVGKA